MTRPVTHTRLKNIALFYLERYEATASKLKTVLLRRVQKGLEPGESVSAQAHQWIQQVVAECERLGYINDARYAENMVRRLSEQGKSARFIQQKLNGAGVDSQIIQELLSPYNDYESARIFARKKRLGADYKKDMAKLARAGFSYEIAKQILNKEDMDV